MKKRIIIGIGFVLLVAFVAVLYENSRVRSTEPEAQQVQSPNSLKTDPSLIKVDVTVPDTYKLPPFDQKRTLFVPQGYSVEVFAAGLKGPRFMAFGPDGVLYATLRDSGEVVALPDANHDGVADRIQTIARNLRLPHGIAWYKGELYVGETHQVIRLNYKPGDQQADGFKVIVPNLPGGGMHFTRTVEFGPDDKMYVSVGSSCNSCIEQDPRRAAILQFNPDGSQGVIYAKGLRNAVGLTWRPGTNEFWATENGRDSLGDDIPSDEINVIKKGQDYGWPYCHAGNIPDPQLGNADVCKGKEPPTVKIQAHSATLGLSFYQGDILVAFHGSWNRSVPTGYKIARIPFVDGKPSAPEDWITGWLVDGQVWGRPVQPIVGPDGAIYISDDFAGAIYRVVKS